MPGFEEALGPAGRWSWLDSPRSSLSSDRSVRGSSGALPGFLMSSMRIVLFRFVTLSLATPVAIPTLEPGTTAGYLVEMKHAAAGSIDPRAQLVVPA